MSLLDNIRRLLGAKTVSVAELQRNISPSKPDRKTHKSRQPSDITETERYRQIAQLIEADATAMFVYGRAGSGKSTLIKYLQDRLDMRFAVVAPTGLAALNVEGSTIHSFFWLPLSAVTKEEIKYMGRSKHRDVLRYLDLLIIDEISMVRADVMEGICESLRVNRKRPDLPFGGCQILFTGDLFQLPPIVDEDEIKQFINDNFGLPWFFCAPSLEKVALECVELDQSFRQEDPHWLSLLDNLRCGRDVESTLQEINESCVTKKPIEKALILSPHKKVAERINRARLSDLSSKEISYDAIFTGSYEKPEEQKEDKLPSPKVLRLKEEARVIFTKNDPGKQWVNGSTGKVLTLGTDTITVQLDNGTIASTEKAAWKKISYEYNSVTKDLEKEVTGTFIQFPLRLAWALTIHKAQGLTLNAIHLELENEAWDSGQIYVALSRCKTMENVSISRELRDREIKVSEEVQDFYQAISDT